MSGAGAPDLAEPLLGFRAWRLASDGALVPWSAGTAGTWLAGDNTARCLAGGGARHAVPGHRCTCGLYALTDVRDPRLVPGREAVGAVVAWGDVEAHRTGFRAQHARVVALARPVGAHPAHLARLERAAARYAVALVPWDGLEAEGLRHGRPLAFDLLPRDGHRAAPAEVPGYDRPGVRGYAVDDHLVVETVPGGVRVSLTPQLAAALPAGAGVEVLAADVARGDPLVRAGEYLLGAPVSGRVARCAGAVCEVSASAWDADAPHLRWGRPGARAYAAVLAHDARAGDPFRFVRAHWLRAHAGVRSPGDVREGLRRAREAPRFATPDAAAAHLGGRLRRALGDPEVARLLGRAGVTVVWRLHRPELDVALDLRARGPRVRVGEVDPGAADLVLHCSAEIADDYFAGRLDLPRALRRRDVQTRAPLEEVLRLASIVKRLHPAYARG